MILIIKNWGACPVGFELVSGFGGACPVGLVCFELVSGFGGACPVGLCRGWFEGVPVQLVCVRGCLSSWFELVWLV